MTEPDPRWLTVLTKDDLLDEIKPTADKVRLIEIHCDSLFQLIRVLLLAQGLTLIVLFLLLYFAIR